MITYHNRKSCIIGIFFLLLGANVALGANPGSWGENFDSYTNGQFLDGGADDGGWNGWDYNPAYGAYVHDDYSFSQPHSVEITGTTDLVHEYTGYTSGIWEYRALQYIPSDFSGISYLILLSGYDGGGSGTEWAVQLRFDGDLDVVESDYNGEQAPLIYETWVQISCIIDLDYDWLKIYYDGELLAEHAWSDTPEGTGGGTLNVAAVDLFANGATSVFYDDMCLVVWFHPIFIDAGGPYSGHVNQDINFTGFFSGGTEPYIWSWDFGDGATASVQNPTHAYSAAGNYTATLTVTDAESNTVSDTATVTIFPLLPVLEVGAITGGLGITSSVRNIGEGAATNLEWSIRLGGNLVFLGTLTTGSTTTLAAGRKVGIQSSFIFGIGKTNIDVSVTCDENVTAEVTKNAFVLGPFVLLVQ